MINKEKVEYVGQRISYVSYYAYHPLVQVKLHEMFTV